MSKVVDLDIPYILEHYANGVEGAHASLAYSLESIMKASDYDLPGYDSDTFQHIMANHVTILDAMMRFMLVEAGPSLTVVKNDGDAA